MMKYVKLAVAPVLLNGPVGFCTADVHRVLRQPVLQDVPVVGR